MTGFRAESLRGIAARMFAGGASEDDVRAVLVEHHGCSRDAASKTISALRAHGAAAVVDRDERQKRYVRNARAGIMHLVDLKRAGHSPTVTELRFRTDLDTPTRYLRAPSSSSYLGSSSAMCAELGGS